MLGDICNIYTGGECPDDCIKNSEKTDLKPYPVYSNGIGEHSIYGYSSNYKIDQDAVTFSSIGTIGYPEIRKGKFTPIIRLKTIVPKDTNVINLVYLKYILEAVKFSFNKSSVPNVNAQMIKNIQIPLPHIDVQRKVANILQNFSDYIHKIAGGLPLEINLRHKQYEYYRNKLLTFKELRE